MGGTAAGLVVVCATVLLSGVEPKQAPRPRRGKTMLKNLVVMWERCFYP